MFYYGKVTLSLNTEFNHEHILMIKWIFSTINDDIDDATSIRTSGRSSRCDDRVFRTALKVTTFVYTQNVPVHTCIYSRIYYLTVLITLLPPRLRFIDHRTALIWRLTRGFSLSQPLSSCTKGNYARGKTVRCNYRTNSESMSSVLLLFIRRGARASPGKTI